MRTLGGTPALGWRGQPAFDSNAGCWGSRGANRSNGTHLVVAEQLVPHAEQLLRAVLGNGNSHSTHLPHESGATSLDAAL